MALRLSTGLRNALLGTNGWKGLMSGGKLTIWTGGQPASADYTETGSKLAELTATFGTAADGSITVAASWSGTVAVAGIAGWFRLYGTAGTTGSSATEVRLDGNCGVSGADLNFTNSSLRLGAALTCDEFTITEPAS